MTTATPPLRVAYVGNFRPPHSTENHVARALEANGHMVDRWQENTRAPWVWDGGLPEQIGGYDLLLWTRTGWDWPAECDWTWEQAQVQQGGLLAAAREVGVPSVGYHLDRWWGLDREGQIKDEAFFRVDVLCTADGGHDRQWAEAGVNHRWFPPGVSRPECEPGTYRPALASDVAFVGSHLGHYHKEWPHRNELVAWLRRTYGRRVAFYPQVVRGRVQPAVRGEALRDLYASVKVLVGDSCLAGGATHYWSDRIPETLGRGGFLVHPWVEGLQEHYTPVGYPSRTGGHLECWALGDWEALQSHIEYALETPDHRCEVAARGRAHTLAHHTYERRMEQLVAMLVDEGRL